MDRVGGSQKIVRLKNSFRPRSLITIGAGPAMK